MFAFIASIYEAVGTFLGLASPWKRAFFGAIVGFAGQLITKPSTSYRKDGSAKQFVTETLFPWWAFPVTGAAVFSLFL